MTDLSRRAAIQRIASLSLATATAAIPAVVQAGPPDHVAAFLALWN